MTEIQSLWDAIDSHNIRLVVFDMDDTLYPEYDYVLSGFEAVAEQLQIQYGVERASEKLRQIRRSWAAPASLFPSTGMRITPNGKREKSR